MAWRKQKKPKPAETAADGSPPATDRSPVEQVLVVGPDMALAVAVELALEASISAGRFEDATDATLALMFGGEHAWRYTLLVTAGIAFAYGVLYYRVARNTTRHSSWLRRWLFLPSFSAPARSM